MGMSSVTTADTGEHATYRDLARTRGFVPLLVSALLTRTAVQAWAIGAVLFALERYHSPTIAGVSIFLLVAPGLLLSPVNGALIDRYGRRRLMRLDFGVAAFCLLGIFTLSATNNLPAPVLFVMLVLGSLTSTLSVAGARSLFPLIVPARLWDRANAADSICYGISQFAGPAIAGALFAAFGSDTPFLGAAIGYVAAALALQWVRDVARPAGRARHVLLEAGAGLLYVLSNQTLRGLAIASSLAMVGSGVVLVAVPLLVFRLHGSAALVGGLFALEGAVSIPAAIVVGRFRSEGHERQIIALASIVMGSATLLLLVPAVGVISIALLVIGAANGPQNVALFSLRQRRTERVWFGRAFAISVSLNTAGSPIGSALSGPILSSSVTLALILAAALALLSAVLVMTLVPGRADAPADTPS